MSKVATCACGCKTIELEEVSRDLISIEVITHTTQYVGKKTKCPCCNKEYLPKFPSNVNSIINYEESIKALVVYLNSYCNMPNQKVTELLGLLSNGKIKTKLKIAGGFRNLKFSKYYCSAVSIIDTCKKQNMNIYETLKNIFMGKKKIFAF